MAEVGVLTARLTATAAANRAQRIFASAARKEALDRELELRTAEQVATSLGNMKGALMKLGQLASFADDGMPEPVRAALAQLQSDAPPMSPQLAAEVVEDELGSPPEKLFAEWDPVPIAAASIGQVHRAMTHAGEAVAVKLQYPGIARAIASDLDNIDLIGLIAPVLFKGLDVDAVAAELRARVSEELDYQLEAQRQQRFADFYRGHPHVHVPEVLSELSGARVLTSELSDGARFAELETWDQAEKNLAGETIYRFAFSSIYRMHAFNGDPHPGNYLFHGGGRVTFLDFGLVKEFTDIDIKEMLAMVGVAVVDRRPGAVRRMCEELGFIVPGAPVGDEAVEDFMAVFFDLLHSDEVTTVTPEWASGVARRLMRGRATHADVVKWANMPAKFLILQRINVGLFAILGQLSATANWRRITEEIWPTTLGPPSTPMGEREHAWLAVAHPEILGSRQTTLT
jgi:predicted unusual protein kinase regulating ubiquinone biosynthesis (AarF/ABC1/UbiB family)